MIGNRALCLVRQDIVYRRDAFCSGLEAAGYRILNDVPDPAPGDVLLIWNRYGPFDAAARIFEAAGATVLVTENGWLGKKWRGEEWFTLCDGHHAGAGTWSVGDASRWDGWSVNLEPWRTAGERVILRQRQIGEPGIASPPQWAEMTQVRFGGRIRYHPGQNTDVVPIEEDLANCGECLTWASGGALKALMMGIPVRYDMPKWIGARACLPLESEGYKRSDEDRLAMFRRLAWSMWSLSEIASGVPFQRFRHQ